MNIFYLDSDPKICAQYHCDKHVVKMIVETAQILSTVHHIHKSYLAPKLYKPTHINHPCVKWTAQSIHNYYFLDYLFNELLNEYTYRYSKIHACEEKARYLSSIPTSMPLGDGFTPPPQCMPQEYQEKPSFYSDAKDDTIRAYQRYYIGEKSKFAKWTIRSEPEWFTIGLTQSKSMV